MNIMIEKKSKSYMPGNIICTLLLVSFFLSGCAPLKKKFTRQKKKDRQQSQKFVPILEPIDYPEKEFSAEAKYKHHYSLWQIWDRDLLQVVDHDGSTKRQSYLLAKVILELGEMSALLAAEKQSELQVIVDNMIDLQKEYDKPTAMRNKFSMKKSISSNSRAVRNAFSPKLALPYHQ